MDTSAHSQGSSANPNLSSSSLPPPPASAAAANFSYNSGGPSLGGQTSSSSSLPYTELLSTISSLQLDLQRTVNLASTLKLENSAVRKNYDELKTSLIRTRARYTETRSSLLSQMSSAASRDSAVEASVSKWKAQLLARTKELEELQANLAPQDLDMLRVKLQEELEAAHSSRLRAVDKEVTKWRQMFFQVRREYELVRTEFQEHKVSSSSSSSSAHDQRRLEVSALQRALVKAQQREKNGGEVKTQEDVQRLQRRVEEMRVVEEVRRRGKKENGWGDGGLFCRGEEK